MITRSRSISKLKSVTVVAKVIIGLGLIISLLLGNVARAQSQRQLFGVRLPTKVSAVLSEVERSYGKSVSEEWLSSDDPMSGNSKVASDGTPFIQINPSHGKTADVILHELYHFKLRTDGYPVILWLFPPQMNTEANAAAFNQLAKQLYDPILHHAFYREAREGTGINPGESFERRTRQFLSDRSYISTVTAMDRGAAALHYFKIRLEVDDQKLLQQVRVLLERERKQDGVELGERLVSIVIHAGTLNPAKAIRVFLDCLNEFYQTQLHFGERPWRSRKLGQHTQSIAPIEVRPLR